jgi:hypothetical protein
MGEAAFGLDMSYETYSWPYPRAPIRNRALSRLGDVVYWTMADTGTRADRASR